MNCQICIAIITLRTLCFVFLLNLSYTQRLQSSFACSQINKNKINKSLFCNGIQIQYTYTGFQFGTLSLTHTTTTLNILCKQLSTHMLILTEGGKPENLEKTPRGTGENNTSNKVTKLTYDLARAGGSTPNHVTAVKSER
jgi:hypothetical protein